MANDKKILKSSVEQRKNFSYSLGTVNMNFNLRVDVKQELKDGKDILLQAIKDFDAELGKIK